MAAPAVGGTEGGLASSAHFRSLSLLCRHRDLPPQVPLPSPGLHPARTRPGVPNAFRGDTPLGRPSPGARAQRPARLSLVETHLGVAVGSQCGSWPRFWDSCRTPPPPLPCHRVQFPSRGSRPCATHQKSSRGGPSPSPGREAQPWGNLG